MTATALDPPRVARPIAEAEVAAFLAACALALDADDLEAWPELFVADGVYTVLSRENVELGLPAPLMYYYSRDMMRDRVTALRDALTYQPVYTRRIVSAPLVSRGAQGEVRARSSFSLHQTTEEGATALFCVGGYNDVLVDLGEGLRFSRRQVTMDTFGVLNLLATPL